MFVVVPDGSTIVGDVQVRSSKVGEGKSKEDNRGIATLAVGPGESLTVAHIDNGCGKVSGDEDETCLVRLSPQQSSPKQRGSVIPPWASDANPARAFFP